MAIGYTTILRMPKPDQGTANWATYMQRLADIADGGVVTVTKVSGATTLPNVDGAADGSKKPIIRTTRTLTATVVVNVPAKERFFLVENLSGGTGRFKVQTASNNIGVIVPKNRRMWLRSSATAGVLPASRTDGRATATEIGVGIITATLFAAGGVNAAALATGAVGVTKLAPAASYGRLLVSQTGTFAWSTLARGTPNQVLSMSTAASPMPSWKTPAARAIATSTAMSIAAGDTKTYTHGITGISNKYDYLLIQPILVCLSADLNFSAGDCLYGPFSAGDTHNGLDCYADSTTTVKVDITTSTFAYLNKNTQAIGVLDLTKWALRVKVVV